MPDKFLSHHGIMGQKWGVRRTEAQLGRAEKKLKRTAEKDAKRAAVAKAAYGKGAGIQRRLVKTELENRLNDPKYKKYYDDAMVNMNKSKVVNKAIANSRGRAAKDQSTRTAKMIAKSLTGTTSLAAGYILYTANKQKIDAFVVNTLRTIKSKIG